MLRQDILIRTFKTEKIQLCIPKIILPDTLLTLHRQRNSIHIGIKKLIDKFEECFYSPDVKSYATLIICAKVIIQSGEELEGIIYQV